MNKTRKNYRLETNIHYNKTYDLYQTEYRVFFKQFNPQSRFKAMTDIFETQNRLNKDYGKFSEHFSYVTTYLQLDNENAVTIESSTLEDLLEPLKYEGEVDYLERPKETDYQ